MATIIVVAFNILTMDRIEFAKNLNESVKHSPVSSRKFVIQTKMPDGIKWFTGIGVMPGTEKGLTADDGKVTPPIIVNYWSPYPEDVMRLDKASAVLFNKRVIGDAVHAVIVSVKAMLSHAALHPYTEKTYNDYNQSLKQKPNDNQ